MIESGLLIVWGVLLAGEILGNPFRSPGQVGWEEALLLLASLVWLFRFRRSGPGGPVLLLGCVVLASTLSALWRECGRLDGVLAEQLWIRAWGWVPLDQAEIYNIPHLALTWLEGILIFLVAGEAAAVRRWGSWLFAGLGVVVALVGLGQRWELGPLPEHWLRIEPALRRVGSIFDDPNVLGSVLCLSLPMLVQRVGLLRGALRWAGLLAVGACGLCVLFTWSRAAIGALVFWQAWRGFRASRISWRWLSAGGALIVLLLAWERSSVEAWLLKTWGQKSLESALGGRSVIWSQGLHMAADFPALGAGPGSVYRRYPLYCVDCGQKGEGVSPGSRWEGRNLHNLFLQIGAELGVFGLVGFLWLMGCVLFPESGVAGGVASAARVGVGLFLLTALTGHPFVERSASNLFWLACGLSWNGRSLESRWQGPPPWWRLGVWLALLLAGGLQMAESWSQGRFAVVELGLAGAPTASRSWGEMALVGSGANSRSWWWMGRQARIDFVPGGGTMIIPILLRTPELAQSPLTTKLWIDGRLRSSRLWKAAGAGEWEIPLRRSEIGRPLDARLEVSRVTWKDDRPLGMAMRSFQFEPRSSIGFWPEEEQGRWGRLELEGRLRGDGEARLLFSVLHPDVQSEPLEIELFLDDELERRLVIGRPGPVELTIQGRGRRKILLELSRTWSPLGYGISGDARELGLYFSGAEFGTGPVAWDTGPGANR